MSVDWDCEEIPLADQLYMRAHFGNYSEGKLLPGVFKEKPNDGDGMSTNWCKYSNPELTRLGNNPERASENGVIALKVSDVVAIRELSVKHDPIRELPHRNRAHTLVHGVHLDPSLPKPEARRKLLRKRTDLLELCDELIMPEGI
jgi:hypothetical protein